MPMKPKREISIVERRLKSGSIFTTSSKPIPLAEPDRWAVRIVNSQISDARVWEMQAEKGWVYVTPEDLAVKAHEIGFREQDGRVVRGTSGSEVLMKMETEDYRAIQKQKDLDNRQRTFGKKAVREAVIGAAQAEPEGARGADFLHQALKGITVTDGRGGADE